MCRLWSDFRLEVIESIGLKLTKLSRFGDVLEQSEHLLDGCKYCLHNSEQWRCQVQKAIQKLPSFSNA